MAKLFHNKKYGKIVDELVVASKCEREIIVYGAKVILFNASMFLNNIIMNVICKLDGVY